MKEQRQEQRQETSTKTIRVSKDILNRISDIYKNDNQYATEKELYSDLLYRGLRYYYENIAPYNPQVEEKEEGEEKEERKDDRISLYQLHTYSRQANRGEDKPLREIADINTLRIYLKEIDRLKKKEDIDEMSKAMYINLHIARFSIRYFYLRYLFYLDQLINFPISHLIYQDERSDFIYILDYSQSIYLDMEQEKRIRHLFDIYDKIGTIEGDEIITEGG